MNDVMVREAKSLYYKVQTFHELHKDELSTAAWNFLSHAEAMLHHTVTLLENPELSLEARYMLRGMDYWDEANAWKEYEEWSEGLEGES